MLTNLKQVAENLIRAFKANLVPIILGSPAGGKSSVVHQVAKQFSLKVIDLRLAQCDPCDLLGFPSIDPTTGRARYAPMTTFPIEGDKLPEGMNGWLLFLDEFTSASPAVQAAAYKLVLDRMVGEHHLHPSVYIACAGNLETDNAIVEAMSTALQSRLVHLEVEVCHETWIEWAIAHDIDHRITSYVRFKPEVLYTFSPDHTDKTYASPRTWEFASRLIQDEKVLKQDLLPILAGTISEGVAREFMLFCQIYADLPTMQQITANPLTLPVPDEPSVLFALSGSIASHIGLGMIDKVMPYLKRLPDEFQVITLREAVARNRNLMQEETIRDWVAQKASELF